MNVWLKLVGEQFLQLNPNKSEFILFGKKGGVEDVTDCMELFHGKNLSGVKNLGLIFDSKHKFYQQINAFVKNISFHLISISKLKSILYLMIWRKLGMPLCHLVWIIVMHCVCV